MKDIRVVRERFAWPGIGGLAIALSMTALGVSGQTTTPAFTPTGSLRLARAGHQATLLLDGRVLVTGGYDSTGRAIARAELFSAGTGAWSEGASNIEAKTDHAATRLRDGRVLVVGGASSISTCSSTATAELYDPAADTWSLMPDLPIATGTGMSALLLGDGRVLVSGGDRCGRIARTAALFNPSTSQWSTTAAMNAPRAFHSAVLLADSRVLVMGGVTEDGGLLPTAELYNPASATWTVTKGPETPRRISCGAYIQTFLATLQNGSVLAAGGVAGDCLAGAAPAVNVDLFDPSTSRWSHVDRPQVARALTTVTALPDGRLMVTGGYAASGRIESSAEFFDPTTGGWNLIGTLRTPRAGHTATRLTSGAVLIAGGSDAVGRTPTAEIYMPAISYTSGPLCAPRGDSSSSPLAGRPWGVATNSKGHVFLALTRAGERTRVIEYAPSDMPFPDCWQPIREIGAGAHGFVHALRIDRNDNMWTVDRVANAITKFSPEGRVLLRIGHTPSTGGVQDVVNTGATNQGGPELEGPTDVTWDSAGSIFVSDGREDGRVVKYDSAGRFITATESAGPGLGPMKTLHSIAVDRNGNVYVTDGGNARVLVFDNRLNPRAAYDGIGKPWAVCITPGPRQYLYSSSNPEVGDSAKGSHAEVYKLELDGTIVGSIGGADDSAGGFGTLHFMDCRDEHTIVASGFPDWVQVIKLQQ